MLILMICIAIASRQIVLAMAAGNIYDKYGHGKRAASGVDKALDTPANLAAIPSPIRFSWLKLLRGLSWQ